MRISDVRPSLITTPTPKEEPDVPQKTTPQGGRIANEALDKSYLAFQQRDALKNLTASVSGKKEIGSDYQVSGKNEVAVDRLAPSYRLQGDSGDAALPTGGGTWGGENTGDIPGVGPVYGKCDPSSGITWMYDTKTGQFLGYGTDANGNQISYQDWAHEQQDKAEQELEDQDRQAAYNAMDADGRTPGGGSQGAVLGDEDTDMSPEDSTRDDSYDGDNNQPKDPDNNKP